MNNTMPPTPDDSRWVEGIKAARESQRPGRSPKRPRSREKTLYSVPRRFDIATLLVVSFVYSLLFTGLRLLDAPWPVFAFVGGLTVLVAIVQPLFPYGNEPRWASAIAGLVYCALWIVVVSIAVGEIGAGCAGLLASIIFGPPLGYLTGAVEAGVFLVADLVRKRITPVSDVEATSVGFADAVQSADDTAPPPSPAESP